MAIEVVCFGRDGSGNGVRNDVRYLFDDRVEILGCLKLRVAGNVVFYHLGEGLPIGVGEILPEGEPRRRWRWWVEISLN